MVTAHDVLPRPLIEGLAAHLESVSEVTAPAWSEFVKTGNHRENAPHESNWWELRCAAILRKIAIRGRIGTERLSAEFGGRKDRRNKPYKAVKGSRNIARKAMQQLEQAGLLERAEAGGRILTPAGQRLVGEIAYKVFQGGEVA